MGAHCVFEAARSRCITFKLWTAVMVCWVCWLLLLCGVCVGCVWDQRVAVERLQSWPAPSCPRLRTASQL
jgi:hypothetical protein